MKKLFGVACLITALCVGIFLFKYSSSPIQSTAVSTTSSSSRVEHISSEEYQDDCDTFVSSSTPWFHNCGEVSASQSALKFEDWAMVPTFLSATVTGMEWKEGVFVGSSRTPVRLLLHVAQAQAVYLEKLGWNEGSSQIIQSFPLQRVGDDRYLIETMLDDMDGTTYSLRAEGMWPETRAIVHLRFVIR